MKIRFLKNWCGEIEKKRLQEVWDVSYSRWTELNVEAIKLYEDTADIITYDEDIILNVPTDVFTYGASIGT